MRGFLSDIRTQRRQRIARRDRKRRMSRAAAISLLTHLAALLLALAPPYRPLEIPPVRAIPSGERAPVMFFQAAEAPPAPRLKMKQEEANQKTAAPLSQPPPAPKTPEPEPPNPDPNDPNETENAQPPQETPKTPETPDRAEPLELPPLELSESRSRALTAPRRTTAARALRPGAAPTPNAAKQAPAQETPESTDESADETEGIEAALQKIAQSAGGEEAAPTDIVFLLDLSGSMENNIRAVGESLSMIARRLQERGVDATFGVVTFKVAKLVVFPQKTDIAAYERLLAIQKVGGNEHALSALRRAMEKVKFRPQTQRRFILITDEPLEGKPPFVELLPALMRSGIVVDVIGLDIPQHRLLARSTGGLWLLIPGG